LKIQAIQAQIEASKAHIQFWSANLHVDPNKCEPRKTQVEIMQIISNHVGIINDCAEQIKEISYEYQKQYEKECREFEDMMGDLRVKR